MQHSAIEPTSAQQRNEENKLREARDEAQAAYDHAIEQWREV